MFKLIEEKTDAQLAEQREARQIVLDGLGEIFPEGPLVDNGTTVYVIQNKLGYGYCNPDIELVVYPSYVALSVKVDVDLAEAAVLYEGCRSDQVLELVFEEFHEELQPTLQKCGFRIDDSGVDEGGLWFTSTLNLAKGDEDYIVSRVADLARAAVGA